MKQLNINNIAPLSIREKRLVALAVLALIVGLLVGVAMPEKQGSIQVALAGGGPVGVVDEGVKSGANNTSPLPRTPRKRAVEVATKESKRPVVDRLSVFVTKKVGASPVDKEYINGLYRASGGDDELTALAVGIAYAETTFGMHPLAQGRNTNYMGYDIAHGYDPVSQEVFAKRLMRGLVGYRGAHKNRALAVRYTGGDRVDSWMYAVNEVMRAMGF